MARNKVQFQRGLSDVEFDRLYGTEEKCREVLFSWRWPGGFECPACGGFAHCELEKRALWQCNACRTQTSLTAGTIFAFTKLDLTVWFRAMFHMTQTKQGISALELSRRLDVNYNTAWKMHHAPRRLAEFEYRFNRRYDLQAMIPASAGSPCVRRRCRIGC